MRSACRWLSPNDTLVLGDYHTHTPLCRHAEGAPEEYVSTAIEKGLDEIGFSDHNPFPRRIDDWRMDSGEWKKYVGMVNGARRKFARRIGIRFGVEQDYIPEWRTYIKAFVRSHDFDYVIGSVHYVDGLAVDYERNKRQVAKMDREKLYHDYFRLIRDMCETRIATVVGHIDLPKKFGLLPPRDLSHYAKEAVRAACDNEMAIEINTSGFRWPACEQYPASSILKLVAKFGGRVCFGSDAHKPVWVGEGINVARLLAKDAGIRRFGLPEARRT